jgi:group I intron endonuclease
MAAGIYKITSPIGKVYIGQSWDIQKRFFGYKKSHNFSQPRLSRSFKKYGVYSHKLEICHELPQDCSQQVMDTYEILYWELYKDLGTKMLNIKYPGSGGKHSVESKIKIKNSILGSKHSEDTLNKMRSPRKKVTCNKCGLTGGGANMTRYHFDNCGKTKQKLNYRLVKCPYCEIEGKGSNMTRYHFNNCKNNK